MKAHGLLAAALAVALSGCISPMTVPNPPSLQRRVSHGVDIGYLAGEVADSFALRVKAADKPLVYVAPGPADMAFAGPFKTMLEQALRERGFAVSQDAIGAEILNFDVQPFLYGQNQHKYLVEYNTFWSTWAEIGHQLSKITDVEGAYGAGLAVGPVLDVLDSLDQATPAEVVLVVSVVDAHRVYYSDTRTIYVAPADLPFYMTAMPTAAPQMMAATSDGLPVVSLRISGYGR
jgi:hypothetical protein